MKYIKIHKEGKWIIAFTLFALLAVNVIIYLQFPKPILAVNIVGSAFLFIFVMFFLLFHFQIIEAI